MTFTIGKLYKETKEKKYLAFAEYIISTGGCSDCNLVELALADELYPYQYPVTKAYEMMSFYEGLLAYYEITGNQKYLDAVTRFMDKVAQSDLTLIGCSGCTHELFDNSSVMQTEYHENIMQETCVTVTWMRVNRRLFEITKNAKYIDRFEISAFNALYGSLNTELNEQWCVETKSLLKGKAFDSYSPLYMNKRGRGVGGYNGFSSGDYSGCCIVIGACGIALVPLTAMMQENEKIYVNILFNGKACVQDTTGRDVWLRVESDYPADGYGKIIFEDDCSIELQIRKPDWCEKMTVNGICVKDDYFALKGDFSVGDSVEIQMKTQIKTHLLNGKVAFTYGALTLASDEQKCDRQLEDPICIDHLTFKKIDAKEGELVRFVGALDGNDTLVLADYQACGKKWLSEKPRMTVWFPTKKE